MEKDEKNAYVDERYATRKDDDYGNVISDILAKGCCPFCPEFFKWHRKPILIQKEGWLITESSWPYKNAKHHFLIIPNKHLKQISDLSPEDLKTVFDLATTVAQEKNIPGGGIILRFGDTRYTGATVTHLHFHLISPEKKEENEASETVNFPIG